MQDAYSYYCEYYTQGCRREISNTLLYGASPEDLQYKIFQLCHVAIHRLEYDYLIKYSLMQLFLLI
jgi:hypothetical protein